jgi:hypothetical protein
MRYYTTEYQGKLRGTVRTSATLTAEEAVQSYLERNARTYSERDELERMQAQIDALGCLVGRLLDELHTLRPEQVQNVLAYGFEAED